MKKAQTWAALMSGWAEQVYERTGTLTAAYQVFHLICVFSVGGMRCLQGSSPEVYKQYLSISSIAKVHM